MEASTQLDDLIIPFQRSTKSKIFISALEDA